MPGLPTSLFPANGAAAHGETIAEHGMITTTHPLAVRIGVEILIRAGTRSTPRSRPPRPWD